MMNKNLLNEQIKAKIIEELMKGTHSFSDLLKKTDLKDSGKFNYHLKQLINADLITKSDEGYDVTTQGEFMGVYIRQFQQKEMYPVSVTCPLITHNNKIFLVRRGKKPFKGFWAFPGGKINIGESVEEATLREVKEETGLDVEFKRPIGFYPVRSFSKDKLLFHANLIGVEAKLINPDQKPFLMNDELDDFGFFTLEEAKNLKMIPVNEQIIRDSKIKEFSFSEHVISDGKL